MVRAGVAALAFALLVYIVMVGGIGIELIRTGELIAQIMGWVLMFLPLLGLWALAAELRFGWQSQRLLNRLEEEQELPGLDLPRQASGKIDSAAAAAALTEFEEAAAAPESRWQDWMRLGLMQDAARNRSAARKSIREAISRSE